MSDREYAEGAFKANGRACTFWVCPGSDWGFDYRIEERGGKSWSGTCPDFFEAFDCVLSALKALRDERKP